MTFHSLRRTYASLAYEANIDPVWTRSQIGHKSARFTQEVYADAENRTRGLAGAVGDLIRAAERAGMGRNGSAEHEDAVTRSADSALESARGG